MNKKMIALVMGTTLCLFAGGCAAVQSATKERDMKHEPLDLQSMIDKLPDNGGLIDLPAGVFEVKSPARLDKPNVTISGVGNATKIVVRPSGGRVDFVEVLGRGDGFKIENCAFEWHSGKNASDMIVTRCAQIRVSDCQFVAISNEDRTEMGSFLHQKKREQKGFNKGLWVTGCSFELERYMNGVHLEVMREVYFAQNKVDANMSGPVYGLWCQGVNYVQITGNSFTSFSKRNTPMDSAGVFIDNPGHDLGHLEITGNHFHTFFGEGTCAIRMNMQIYGTISGNVFGRVQGQGNAAIEMTNSSATNISGNEFENVYADSIRLGANCSRISILANAFSDCYKTEVRIEPGKDVTRGISVLGNNFDATSKPHTIGVRVHGGKLDEIYVANNVMYGYVEKNPILVDKDAPVNVSGNLIGKSLPAHDHTNSKVRYEDRE
ncbi:right-handed parallel beta-helix repeat-containing protein [Candidatus Hydrogenedentota bacterium]